MTSKIAKPSLAVTNLVDAVQRVWDAYLEYGPLDDGTKQGKTLEVALDALPEAKSEVKYDITTGFCPTAEFYIRLVRSPGGRGRNSHHWEGIEKGRSWMFATRANSEELVVGKLVVSYRRSGDVWPRVIVRNVTNEPEGK